MNEKIESDKILNYSKKIVNPTSVEIKNHDNFLKNELKKNYF